MTVSLSDARVRYETERADYEGFAQHVKETVSNLLLNRRVPFRSESRAKETRSLLLKLASLEGKLKYEDVRDKAGVRVIVPANRYVQSSVAAIAESVDGAQIVKRNDTKFDATMVTVTQNWSGVSRACEVQVVTESTIWWANLSHRYVYKAGKACGDQTHRSLERLRALAELVDIGVDRIDLVFQSESSVPDRFAIEVSNEWVGFLGVAETGRWEITSQFFTSIYSTGELDLDEGHAAIRRFLEGYRGRVVDCIRVLNAHNSFFASQPELIWILHQLHEKPMFLRSIWPDWLGRELLDETQSWWDSCE